MKEKLVFMNTDEKDKMSFEYIVEEYDGLAYYKEHVYKYPQSSTWSDSLKGTAAGKLIDDGNGVTIFMENKKIKLDYSQLALITAMVLNANDLTVEIKEVKTVKKL